MNKYDYVDCKGKSVLDIGCSIGNAFRCLLGFKSYMGIDNDKMAIKYAKETFNANFICNDSIDNIAGKYDIILLFDVLEHINKSQQSHMVEKALHLLGDNGKLYITTPNREVVVKKCGRTEKYHPHELSVEEIKNILNKHDYNIKSFNPKFSKSIMRKIELFTILRKFTPYIIFKYTANYWKEPDIEVHDFNPNDAALFIEVNKK